VFGAGTLSDVPELVAGHGKSALIVTGDRSFRAGPSWEFLSDALNQLGVRYYSLSIKEEPSPQVVDESVAEFHGTGIEVVLGIGGGSVLDAAKAIAGLLPHGNSVMDHLEGVGAGQPYLGPATPFIAVPTTAGTGSEATKNAVLSVVGEDGFKKSFRHEALVPAYAVVDPELLATCPPALIAANGMDALTQLIEAYVSSRANPFTDALALSGIEAVKRGLLAAYEGGDEPEAADGRTAMAYGSLISGITLAQVGLGSVHGLASPIGAFFPIPHGVVCGTLLAPATEINIAALGEREPTNPALMKYAELADYLCDQVPSDDEDALDMLVDTLNDLTEHLDIPLLSEYGITEDDIDRIVANSRGSSMQTNPIVLADEEIADIVYARL
jgi:alcohol dehydrogenase